MTTMEILTRIVLAILIGGFIGYEREMKNRPAGFITHTLVCVGAAVVSLMQLHMINDTISIIKENPVMAASLKADIGRVVAQVITGVGFLGAGTIIIDKGSVKGLTTATTLWVVACLGLSIGLGYYEISIISAVVIIFIIVVLKRVEVIANNRKHLSSIEVSYYSSDCHFIEDTVKFFRKNKYQVRNIKLLDSSEEKIKKCKFKIYSFSNKDKRDIIEKLALKDSVITINHK